MKLLLCLLLVGMLVACSEDSSTDDPQCSSYSLSMSDVEESVNYGSKLTIDIEVHDDGELAEDSSEITLAITCGEHKVVDDKKQKTTDGKATFADIAVSGDNFANKCSVKATADLCDLTDESNFTVVANTSLPYAESLPPLTEKLKIGSITVGRPIDITVPAGVSGKVKLQPQEFDKCIDHFLIHNEGDELTQILTGGVVITVSNNKLEGLVLIRKNDEATCTGGFVLAVGNKKHSIKDEDIVSNGSSPNFNGNLEESNGKLALRYSGTPPAAIFFSTTEEGNLWTKYTGSMSSTAVSTLDYSSSGNAALVKTNRGQWSYISN